MLSRVARRIYWMARYIERAENTARLVNTYHFLLLDLPRGTHIGWEDTARDYRQLCNVQRALPAP